MTVDRSSTYFILERRSEFENMEAWKLAVKFNDLVIGQPLSCPQATQPEFRTQRIGFRSSKLLEAAFSASFKHLNEF